MKDKILGKQQEEKDNDTQGTDKISAPKDIHGSKKTTPNTLPQNRLEET